jgi:hypothetical protein
MSLQLIAYKGVHPDTFNLKQILLRLFGLKLNGGLASP